MEFSSKTLENAVVQFKTLPGIGNKTALRMVLHLIKQSPDQLATFEQSLEKLRTALRYCQKCQNISDDEICSICSSPVRDKETICVVQDVRDVLALEATGQYNGLYHVLGGVISPMEGVGPDDLTIAELLKRVEEDGVNEIIFALSATMEGDTTIFYLSKQLQNREVQLSTISRGISVGGELEYVDEVTLGRSLTLRTPYKV